MASQNEEAALFACTKCRSMKLKCGRIKPCCGRCARRSEICDYPHSRRTNVGRTTRVRELEVKLDQLESLARPTFKPLDNSSNMDHSTGFSAGDSPLLSDLIGDTAGSTASNTGGPEVGPWSANLLSTGTFEQRLPPEVLEYLTNSYFDKWHHVAPMLHQARYTMSLQLPPHMRPPMCLQYIVMAWGAEMGKTHRHLSFPFYQRARAYAAADEIKTWCLMCYFEAHYLLFSRSSMSIARAIRIAQMLGLHRVDADDLESIYLMPPPQSWLEAEERRRTWWALYCSDRLVGGTTGLPVLINEQEISARLPASEAAFETGTEEITSLWTSTFRPEGQEFSAFARRALAASLFHQAFMTSDSAALDEDSGGSRTSMYWNRHREIDNNLVLLLQALPDDTKLPKQIRCRNATFVNVIIHMSIICLHRAAICKMKVLDLPQSMISRSRARLVCAAEEILGIFRMMSDVDENLKNSILTFSIYMVSQVVLEDLESEEENLSRQDNLDFILRLMILSAKTLHNPVTLSMAVQLAVEMSQRDLNSTAVEALDVRGAEDDVLQDD
ncbi:binuclear zinc transcription factor [Fusarium acutatum]|uniref:Binuclear zinc transcription factor n=1 Tax=Fusarium acutatum TaxID=78861 RepID=A0A8H4NC46_9HYPO|nr:binuclear zinc transcription factor [Fusarium acutatum]